MVHSPPISFNSLASLGKGLPKLPMHRKLTPTLGFHLLGCEEIMEDSRQFSPHCHDFFQIIHVTSGSGIHCIDFKSAPLVAPCVYCLHPLQTHYWLHLSSIQGSILAFQEDFLRHSIQSSLSLHIMPIFRIVGGNHAICMTEQQNAELCKIIDDIAVEHENFDPKHPHLLGSLSLTLLTKLQRWKNECLPTSDHTSIDIMQRLHAYLHLKLSMELTLKDCALAIHTSPRILSRALRDVTGLTFSHFLHNEVIQSSKELLKTTNKTIAEIAFLMGFSDPSYFGRFFKRYQSMTPLQFRKNLKDSRQH